MTQQPSSRTCFLCGRNNPFSLKMTWHNDADAGLVRSQVVVPEHCNGYPGIVHGGIVAAILDETAGRAILIEGQSDDLMVTLKLEVRYRQPTPTEVPLQAIGRVIRRSTRRAVVAGEIQLPDGTVTAECEAIVVRPPEEIYKMWEPEKRFWRVYDEGE